MDKNYLKSALGAALCFCALGSWGQTTTFDYTGAIDTYTVPAGVTSISIQAYGGQGGNDNGGLGAGIYGEFTVVPGDVLNIVVGQQGIVNNCGGGDASGGGGGGTFVWDPDAPALPMIAAGGGGGGNENWGGLDCRDGIDGQAGEDGTSGAEGLAAGGTGGNGGAGDAPSGTGSGGGGWLSAGQNSTYGTGCTGGETLPTFAGGSGSTSFGPGGDGGFGGGGGAVCGCGGGGGYSGGAGGNGSSCRAGGGGGGSYNAGAAQVNETGVRTGNGQVVITVLCTGLETTVSTMELCEGEELTLEATSTLGGTITWDMGVENGVAFVPAGTGIITYTATSDADGDCDYSVDIEVLEAADVTVTVDDDKLCAGETVVFDYSGDADSYISFPIDAVPGEPYSPSVGVTSFTVIGFKGTGCNDTVTVEVEMADEIEVAYAVTDEILGSDGEISLAVVGGYPAYTFDWDNDGTGDFDDTQDLTGLEGGTYTVVVVDAEGCNTTEEVEVNSRLAIVENGLGLAVYPNPAKEQLTVKMQGEFSYELVNAAGEIVLSGRGVDNTLLDIKAYAAGVYLLNVKVGDQLNQIKVIKE